MRKHISRVITLIVLLGALFTAPTASAACAPPFAGTLIQYTINGGQSYQPAPFHVVKYLQSIASCPITGTIILDQYQQLGFSADYTALIVWSAKNDTNLYVHRGWLIYPVTREQWNTIILLLGNRVGK